MVYVSQQERHIKIAQLNSLMDNFLSISLIRVNIFLCQGKVIIFAIKRSMFSLEKQMHYQRKCLYEYGKTKILLKLPCLLRFLLYMLCREMISCIWAHQSTTCFGFSVSSVLLCTLKRCVVVLFGVRKASLFSYRNIVIILKMGYYFLRRIYYKSNARLQFWRNDTNQMTFVSTLGLI